MLATGRGITAKPEVNRRWPWCEDRDVAQRIFAIVALGRRIAGLRSGVVVARRFPPRCCSLPSFLPPPQGFKTCKKMGMAMASSTSRRNPATHFSQLQQPHAADGPRAYSSVPGT